MTGVGSTGDGRKALIVTQHAGAGAASEGDASLATDQTMDSFARLALGGGATVRLLYRRCHEARAQGLPGQDYAQLVSARHGTSLRFCVADGVGGSYKGDFAARFLSERLVSWLGGLDGIPGDEAATRERLAAALAEWAAPAQAALRGIAFPEGATGLVGEVLMELREGHGSEAVFVAGRVERALGADAGADALRARALLCWMGNVSAWLYTAAGDAVPLGQSGDDRDRWSTLRGPRGRLALRTLALPTLRRLIVHTDGLDGIGPAIARLDDAALGSEADRLLGLPTGDDAAVLDIAWVPSGSGPRTAAGESPDG
jgi:hypothetical protein